VPLSDSSYPPGPSSRCQIDGNVASFYAFDSIWIFVAGGDGNLWLESGFDSIPPGRTQVDGSVAAFQPISLDEIFVLGENGNLWREFGPFGPVPLPPCNGGTDGCRYQVASDVYSFWVADPYTVFVMDNNNNLWVLPYGGSGSDLAAFQNPAAVQVDGNVADFWPVDAETVYVLGQDGNLWLEHGPFGQVPLPLCSQTSGFGQGFSCRDPIASNVNVFGYYPEAGGVFIVDGNFELWQVGPPKVYLAYPVWSFQILNPDQTHARRGGESGARRSAIRPIRAQGPRLAGRNRSRARPTPG